MKAVPVGVAVKHAQGQTDMRDEIFAIGFGTRIMESGLNKQKQVVQIRNTSLLLELLCYIIIDVSIIITINDDGVIGVSSGGGGSSVIFYFFK
jgi:hypothetical protein